MRPQQDPLPVKPGVYSIMSIHIPPKEPLKMVLERVYAEEGMPESAIHRLWGRYEFDRKVTIFRVDDLSLYEEWREGWYESPLVWRAAVHNIDSGSVLVDDTTQTGKFGFRISDGPDPTARHILDRMRKYTLLLSGGGLYWDCNSLYGCSKTDYENEQVERDLLRIIKVQWESLGARKQQRDRENEQKTLGTQELHAPSDDASRFHIRLEITP